MFINIMFVYILIIGWGGIFDGLLQATPKLPLRKLESHSNQQEEL